VHPCVVCLSTYIPRVPLLFFVPLFWIARLARMWTIQWFGARKALVNDWNC
jgi:hypothetical protein